MKTFRKLNAYAEPELLESMIAKLTVTLFDGWLRDREGEERVRPFCGEGQVCFLFTGCAKAEGRDIALAMIQEGRRLFAANIFPMEQGQISIEQYNSALVEFFLEFLHPAALEAGMAITVTSDERERRKPCLGGQFPS
jgi:hypothetical protein